MGKSINDYGTKIISFYLTFEVLLNLFQKKFKN